MGEHSNAEEAPPQTEELRLDRLLPPGDPAGVGEIIEQYGLWSRGVNADRPRVLLNMVASADGRATIAGRSGAMSNAADRALFHGLRMAVDAVLVGAGTADAERYGRIIPKAESRAERVRRGLAAEPLACIVSGRLAFHEQPPLLSEPDARVAFLTASEDSLAETEAAVEYVRAGSQGHVDLTAALRQLRERFAVRSVLCEGGPHLGDQLLQAGLVDELFLSLAPILAGGDPSGEQALRILAGKEFESPIELELLGVLRGDSHLFLRYGVSARERVSRATTPSSSLDS